MVALLSLCAFAISQTSAAKSHLNDPPLGKIDASNLTRFWVAYEAARNVPAIERGSVYQKLYFDGAASPLKYMLARAKMTPTNMAKMVDARAPYFELLHANRGDLVKQASSLQGELIKFKYLYPEAKFPNTYLMIGGMHSGGTTNQDGLLIGAELFGKYPNMPTQGMGDWEKRVIAPPTDVVPLIVHECVHFQQRSSLRRTLLSETLHEGAADFVSYLVTGQMMERTRHLHQWANQKEAEIWAQFQKEMDGSSTKGWLFGNPKEGWPDDVGYWLGYKICECFYDHDTDKALALKEILTMTDPKAFLSRSGYANKFGS